MEENPLLLPAYDNSLKLSLKRLRGEKLLLSNSSILKIGRLALAVVGLLALAVAYFTGSLVFLAIAVVAFVAGLYVMGANKKPIKKEEEKRKGSQNR